MPNNDARDLPNRPWGNIKALLGYAFYTGNKLAKIARQLLRSQKPKSGAAHHMPDLAPIVEIFNTFIQATRSHSYVMEDEADGR